MQSLKLLLTDRMSEVFVRLRWVAAARGKLRDVRRMMVLDQEGGGSASGVRPLVRQVLMKILLQVGGGWSEGREGREGRGEEGGRGGGRREGGGGRERREKGGRREGGGREGGGEGRGGGTVEQREVGGGGKRCVEVRGGECVQGRGRGRTGEMGSEGRERVWGGASRWKKMCGAGGGEEGVKVRGEGEGCAERVGGWEGAGVQGESQSLCGRRKSLRGQLW